MVRRLVNRMGRRGYFLGFFGILGLVYGFYLVHPPAETKLSPSYKQLAAVLPLRWVGCIWVFMGVICLVQMWMIKDRVAFALASAVFGGWSLVYLAGWIFGLIALGWLSATIWLVFAGASMIVAGWPDTDIWVARVKSLPIITLGSDGRILLLSESAEQLFGYSTEELMGRSLEDLLSERHRGIVRYPFVTDWDIAVLALRGDGKEVPVELNITPWQNAEQQGYTATVRRMEG